MEKEERDRIKAKALADIEMVENYPKKFDVTIFGWMEGKSAEDVKEQVVQALNGSGLTYSFGDITEVNDY